ncbi:MAG: YitT family protein [Clostridia bacterium]|nr:YitT family protein [Clostridia bacterium]
MNKILTKKNFFHAKDTIFVIIGTFLMGFSFNVFLNANKISPSGFSGLSAIVSNLMQENLGWSIHPSVFYLCINAVLFLISFKKMGIKFAINTGIGIAAYSLFIEICNFDIGLSGSDLLLCAIYGGVLTGIGLGLVFRGHGSTGGSDLLANIVNNKYKQISVGNIIFIVDAIVVGLSFLAYNNLSLSLYSLIAIWIMTKVSDVVVSGVQGVRGYYIISSKYEEISEAIMKEIDRGVTGFNAKGMYTKSDGIVLLTLVTRSESMRLRQIVSNIDKDAFMFSCPVSEAIGQGFAPLKKEKKNNPDNDKGHS